MKSVVAGVIGGVAANRTRTLSLRGRRVFIFSGADGVTSSSIDGRGDSDFAGIPPAFVVKLSGVPVVGLLSGGCEVVVRRLVKGKAAKRPAADLVPGRSIIRANDPCGALCWAGVEDADGLGARGVGGAGAGGGGAPVTEGAIAFSPDVRNGGSVLYWGLETGARGTGGAELDTVRFSVTIGGRPPNSLGMFMNVRSNGPLLLAGVCLVDDDGSPSTLGSPSIGGEAMPKDALRDGPPISGKNRLGGSVKAARCDST